MKEVLDSLLLPEYLNVQSPEDFKAKVLAALEQAVDAPKE